MSADLHKRAEALEEIERLAGEYTDAGAVHEDRRAELYAGIRRNRSLLTVRQLAEASHLSVPRVKQILGDA